MQVHFESSPNWHLYIDHHLRGAALHGASHVVVVQDRDLDRTEFYYAFEGDADADPGVIQHYVEKGGGVVKHVAEVVHDT